MTTPLITVVIATYKRPEILCRALDSVVSQDYTRLEIIIVDDNGTGSDMQKATEQILSERYDDSRIVYVANENSLGGGGARNQGIIRAQGEYVAFLDDDEDWLPGKLTAQVNRFSSVSGDTGVIDTGFYSIDEKGNATLELPEMQGWIFEDLLGKTTKRAPKLSTMLCRKQALVDAGMFDPAFRSRQDLDLYLRLARICRFESISKPYANKRFDATERISTNVDSKVQGYERIYSKYHVDFMKRPDVHADYLLRFSLVFIRGRYFFRAFKKFVRACFLVKMHPLKVFRFKKQVLAAVLRSLLT